MATPTKAQLQHQIKVLHAMLSIIHETSGNTCKDMPCEQVVWNLGVYMATGDVLAGIPTDSTEIRQELTEAIEEMMWPEDNVA